MDTILTAHLRQYLVQSEWSRQIFDRFPTPTTLLFYHNTENVAT